MNEFKAVLAKEADQQRDSASNSSELRVMIRADRLVRYGYVHEIMDPCTAVGICKIEVLAASPPRKQAPQAARNGPANEPPPAVAKGRDSHPSSLPGPAEGAHPPRELRIGIRPNAHAAEWRVAGGVWRKTTDEWLQDVRASGSVEETTVCLGPTAEVSWEAVVTAMDFLNQEGFERIEFGSPSAVEEPAPSSTEEVPDPHGPLDLRIVHRAQACAAREQGRLCDAAALRMGGGAFQKTIAAMEQDLANDPSVLLLRVSRTRAAQDRDRTVAAIDALDRWVQGDAFLDVLRAQIRLATKEPVAARACAERAVAAEPDLDRGWRVLVSARVTQRDFAAAVTRVTAAEAHGVRFGDLARDPAFEEFVASREYREWAGSRK